MKLSPASLRAFLQKRGIRSEKPRFGGYPTVSVRNGIGDVVVRVSYCNEDLVVSVVAALSAFCQELALQGGIFRLQQKQTNAYTHRFTLTEVTEVRPYNATEDEVIVFFSPTKDL